MATLDISPQLLCDDQTYQQARERFKQASPIPPGQDFGLETATNSVPSAVYRSISDRYVLMTNPTTGKVERHRLQYGVVSKASPKLLRLLNRVTPFELGGSHSGSSGQVKSLFADMEYEPLDLAAENYDVALHFIHAVYSGSLRATLRALASPTPVLPGSPPLGPKGMHIKGQIRVHLDAIFEIARLALHLGVETIYNEAHRIWQQVLLDTPLHKTRPDPTQTRYTREDGTRRQRPTQLDLVRAFRHLMNNTELALDRKADWIAAVVLCCSRDMRRFCAVYDVAPAFWDAMARHDWIRSHDFFGRGARAPAQNGLSGSGQPYPGSSSRRVYDLAPDVIPGHEPSRCRRR